MVLSALLASFSRSFWSVARPIQVGSVAARKRSKPPGSPLVHFLRASTEGMAEDCDGLRNRIMIASLSRPAPEREAPLSNHQAILSPPTSTPLLSCSNVPPAGLHHPRRRQRGTFIACSLSSIGRADGLLPLAISHSLPPVHPSSYDHLPRCFQGAELGHAPASNLEFKTFETGQGALGSGDAHSQPSGSRAPANASGSSGSSLASTISLPLLELMPRTAWVKQAGTRRSSTLSTTSTCSTSMRPRSSSAGTSPSLPFGSALARDHQCLQD